MSGDYIPAADAESQPAAMTGLGTLIGEMRWQLPGCDDLEMRKALSAVFRDFCRCTSALTFARSFPVGEGLLNLRVGVPYSAAVERLAHVLHNGRPVHGGNYRFHSEGVSARLCFTREWVDGVLADGGQAHRVDVKCVLVPQVGAESAPVWFMQCHAEAFVAGALAMLMGMPGRPWSSPPGAARNAGLHNDLCSAAALRQMHDGGETGDIPATCRMGRLPI